MSLFTSDTSFENIVEQQYYLAKKCNVSFMDTNNMPDFEREMMVGMLGRDLKKESELYNEAFSS